MDCATLSFNDFAHLSRQETPVSADHERRKSVDTRLVSISHDIKVLQNMRPCRARNASYSS